APMSVLGRPRAAYRRINEALVAGLRRLGVPAEVAGRGPAGDGGPTATGGPAAGADWAAACFRSPAAGEVVVGGRKLVGSAQRCERRVILQHGSILLSGSQAAAEDLLLDGAGAGGPPAVEGWTTLEEVLGRRPAVSSLAGVLAEAFEGALGTSLAPAGLTEDESRRMNSLRERFASPDWTWRR
ncbi:MAG TPA: hypothetical protein VK966_02870, partial [Longimicrobiales bacterium]|nr:hypothetical protein [Longimicrobiales bacterium]